MAEMSSCTMRQAFVAAVRMLKEAGIDTPELDARILLCHAACSSHEAYMARPDAALQPEAKAKLEAYLKRRVGGEPVSRILGMREFYGREFHLDRHTLDPRPATETLIDAALDHVRRNNWQDRPLDLLDLGTGTGCILLTLLAELPKARGVGTEISHRALALAAANARRLGVASRAAFAAADWLDGIDGTFDVILANPPYVASGEIAGLTREVRDHDPRLALDGGRDGLDAYRRIAAKAAAILRPGGSLIVEIGASQAEEVQGLFRACGLHIELDGVRHDLSGRPRAILAENRARPRRTERRSSKKSLERPSVQGSFGPAG